MNQAVLEHKTGMDCSIPVISSLHLDLTTFYLNHCLIKFCPAN